MDRNSQQILEAFKQILGPGMFSFPATVKENYPEQDYVDVEDMAGTIYPEVRKRAALDGKKGILITPVKGSSVIVSKLSGEDSTSFVISLFSEVESIKVTMEGHILMLDKNGLSVNLSTGKFELKNDQTSLLKLFNTVADIISKLKVPTPAGLSSAPFADTIADVEKFKQELQKILK